MPSVGMRRSTRICVPKTLPKDSVDVSKTSLTPNKSEKNSVIKKKQYYSPPAARTRASGTRKLTHEIAPLVDDRDVVEVIDGLRGGSDIVYARKRRKLMGENKLTRTGINEEGRFGKKYERRVENENEEKRFRKKYYRKRWRYGSGKLGVEEKGGRKLLVEFSKENGVWVEEFLVKVLGYMRKSRLRLSGLVLFMCCEPICGVFGQYGIQFFGGNEPLPWNSSKKDVLSSGVCQIFGARKFLPVFSVNFSAMSSWFVGSHIRILLGHIFLLDNNKSYMSGLIKSCLVLTDEEISHSSISTDMNLPGGDDWIIIHTDMDYSVGGGDMAFEGSPAKKRKVEFVEEKGSPGRGLSGIRTVSFRKRRSSVSSRKARIPTSVRWQSGSIEYNLNKAIRASNRRLRGSGSDPFKNENRLISLSPIVPNLNQKIVVKKNSCSLLKDLRFDANDSRQNIEAASCSANILVIESDKCHREEGATVTLELSSSSLNDCCIVVRIQGMTRYTHKAEKMRPCPTNRFTHAMIWTGASSWKLEFPDRKDWAVFKEIHNECFSRNVEVSAPGAIPVPGVYEVPGYGDVQFTNFVRPNNYIKLPEDEVSRLSVKVASSYDIDSDDEEWLQNLNNGLFNGHQLLANKFERMIDDFEKFCYYSPNGTCDKSTALKICQNLGSKGEVAAVHQYWLRKRKQKPLIRVFQLYPPPRALSMQVTTTCRKRSSKKPAVLYGNIKQPSLLPEWNADEEQKVIMKIEEAKYVAARALEIAVVKRARAQLLMENADMAIYKATMALKIAESVQLSTQVARVPREELFPFFLD